LLLEIDPIGLVRGRRGPSGEGYALEQYVNDGPYAASSFLSVAIARTFGTAISGKSKERQELAYTPLPLEEQITVLVAPGAKAFHTATRERSHARRTILASTANYPR
jgi:hypothetical protein